MNLKFIIIVIMLLITVYNLTLSTECWDCGEQALPPRYGNQQQASTGAAQSSGLHSQPGAAAALPRASSGSMSSAQSAPQLPQVSHV